MQFLVRTTLLALNDANRTGNYTVLRDLAAPSFRERNSAADLAQIFAELRRARLDLSMAAIMAPELDAQPALDADRRLRLKGSYPTQPNRVVFDLDLRGGRRALATARHLRSRRGRRVRRRAVRRGRCGR